MNLAVKQLIQRQETYIEQLEKEAAFCRDQLSNILMQVKNILIENSNEAAEDKAKKEEMLNMLRSLELEMKSAEQFQFQNKKYQEENFVLKQQLERSEKKPKNNEDDNCVIQLKNEVEVLKAREAEAAEQVQKSVKVAEQIRQQKTEAEFEIGQLSSQVERQQARIRTLIEDQVTKVEEERGN